MNMPTEKGIPRAFDELSGEDQASLLMCGQPGTPYGASYLTRKSNKADFGARAQSFPRHERSFYKRSSRKWQGWHAEVSPTAGDKNCTYQNVALDINELIPWVRIIAQKIHRPLPSNVMLNDLIQDGMIGLITALREHDADLGIPFHAFAANKIRWAIMDGLRAGDWAEKSVRRRANKVTKTTEKLQALLHRTPSKSEIADTLGVRVDDITSILGNAYGYNFVRINDGLEGEAQDIPDSRMEPSSIVERREVSSRAISGLRTLQPNERKAFILRILCDMSVMQAASEMGVSESRVSQLYTAASKKLANYVSHCKPQHQ